jgi:hypothetical protein
VDAAIGISVAATPVDPSLLRRLATAGAA